MKRRVPLLVALITIIAVIQIPFTASIECDAASNKTLSWSIVDTPRDRNIDPSGLIAKGSEINALALGSDGQTIYCVATDDNDTALGRNLFKSIDAGTVFLDITNPLRLAGAVMPVWNIALAPDDPNFVMVITDNSTTSSPQGPRRIFYSTDGGNSWQEASIPVAGTDNLSINEYISCVAVSRTYGINSEFRDVAVGTRSIPGPGKVFTRQYSTTGFDLWKVQLPLAESITSLKFSPNYNADSTIVTVSSSGASTFLHLGLHNATSNITSWDDASYGPGYPVNFNFGTWSNVISADLQLPGDFTASVLSQQGCFASIQTDQPAPNATRVFYVNTSLAPWIFNITPPISTVPPSRICSIAYEGNEVTGILLAGEAITDPARGLVNVWQCSNAQTSVVGGATWLKSDVLKSPSGGANQVLVPPGPSKANPILQWSADNQLCYCGTSSDNSSVGGTGWNINQWPCYKLAGKDLDESALSLSRDRGVTWNQINLIDTQAIKLSDVAALEEVANPTVSTEPSVLYLATADNLTGLAQWPYNFDSVWRSNSDPLGRTWERIMVRNVPAHPASSNGDNILRVNPRDHTNSNALVFADLYTTTVLYSGDSGQNWELVPTDAVVDDISLFDDNNLYILEDYTVRRMVRGAGVGGAWLQQYKINTQLTAPAHTITTPLVSPAKTDIVFVGTGKDITGYSYIGYVAWADFSVSTPKFTALKELPFVGNVHVIADSQFDKNNILYAGVNNAARNDGIIYRWTLNISIDWDELDPPNLAFYGIETLNDVLYGAWNFYTTTSTVDRGGVDRTLHSRSRVPPPPEWDQLTYILPITPPYVEFTREPTSLKISSNAYNTLWAIDNIVGTSFVYDFRARTGCLWHFVDSVARVGPQPTSPPPGSYIGADPVSGRSQEVDFKWRQMRDVYGYELLLAKDVDFSLLLTQGLPLYPVDNLTGAWQIPPRIPGIDQVGLADQLMPSAWIPPGNLEAGRPYYWKVRAYLASENVSGQIIHSPWSPAWFFSVKPGFMVGSSYPGPKLLAPADGACKGCRPPVRFGWTPIKDAKKYQFTLAQDPGLKDIIFQTTTSTTAYAYTGALEMSKPYYWQVQAVAPVVSDPSPVGTFTLSIDTPAAPAAGAGQGQVVSTSNLGLWMAILIFFILLFLINVSIIITRHRRDD